MYVSETAAEELGLQGQPLDLTISGTGGKKIRRQSRSVELTVSNIDGSFLLSLEAYVLENIASDTPAIQWSKIKEKWPRLHEIPFENASKRQIDVMIGSDHSLFHLALKEVSRRRSSDPIARPTNLGCAILVEDFRCDSRTHFTRTYRTSQHQVNQ